MKKYVIQGLTPGEAYDISLKTQTGTGPHEQSSEELKRRVVTKPMPLDYIHMEPDLNTNDDKVTFLLNAPDNHSRLKGFELKLSEVEKGNKMIKYMTVQIAKNEDPKDPKKKTPKDITKIVLDELQICILYATCILK